MNDLQTFFSLLLNWEGRAPAQLVATWDALDVTELDRDFRQAVGLCGFRASTLNLATTTSNQAVGNRMEAFLAQQINARLQGFRIDPCLGQGYPDSRLVRVRDNQAFSLEFKATQGFDSADNNRMV